MNLAVLLALAQVSADPGAMKARETAYARIALADKLAADAELVRAIKAKNAANETDAEIQRKDREWQLNPRLPLRKELVQNACATRLTQILKEDPIVVEAFLMDAKGAVVCATQETSDYWQGDEAKWQKTFKEGKKVLVDEPALDASTGTYAVQLSALISDSTGKIGALTLTLKIPR
jgi:hypothetical protein